MRKIANLLLLTAALCLLLSGCGQAPGETTAPAGTAAVSPSVALPSLAQDEEPSYLTATIVDGAETGELLLAGEEDYDSTPSACRTCPCGWTGSRRTTPPSGTA